MNLGLYRYTQFHKPQLWGGIGWCKVSRKNLVNPARSHPIFQHIAVFFWVHWCPSVAHFWPLVVSGIWNTLRCSIIIGLTRIFTGNQAWTIQIGGVPANFRAFSGTSTYNLIYINRQHPAAMAEFGPCNVRENDPMVTIKWSKPTMGQNLPWED